MLVDWWQTWNVFKTEIHQKRNGAWAIRACAIIHARIVCSRIFKFNQQSKLSNILKMDVCPLLIRFFSEKIEFPTTVRIIRVVRIIVKNYIDLLAMECEIFLSVLSSIFEDASHPSWNKVLVLECYKLVLSESNFQK